MEADCTRNSYDPRNDYSAVIMQQGRVQLDADWNEQWVIQVQALRAALRDMIGKHGGPKQSAGFRIDLMPGNQTTLKVSNGTYYVDGIRCVQRNEKLTLDMSNRGLGAFVVFLDVWERHVNAIEDGRIREVALLGPDTATRAQVVWRVRLLSLGSQTSIIESPAATANHLVDTVLAGRPRRRLAARATTANTSDDACKLSPLSQYRGRENQLYRVEIHDGSVEDANENPVRFTFKWSRENGSVVFPITKTVIPEAGETSSAGDQIITVVFHLDNLGRDRRYGLEAGDIVELVHDRLTRGLLDTDQLEQHGLDPGRPGLLGRVEAIDPDLLTARVQMFAPDTAELAEEMINPYLRRWDQRYSSGSPIRDLRAGAVPVRNSDLGAWLPLEDGVEVMFEAPDRNAPTDSQQQRAGDFWLIPARVATGDILWPTVKSGTPPVVTPVAVEPHGPHHHYAPLAVVVVGGHAVTLVRHVRNLFAPAASPEAP